MASDSELLEQMHLNDSQAFADLYDRYKMSVYRYCLKVLADPAAAEDATHETFLKMFSHAGTLQNPQALRVWLLITARNEAMMYFRRQRRNGTCADDDVCTEQTPHDLTVSTENNRDCSNIAMPIENGIS